MKAASRSMIGGIRDVANRDRRRIEQHLCVRVVAEPLFQLRREAGVRLLSVVEHDDEATPVVPERDPRPPEEFTSTR